MVGARLGSRTVRTTRNGSTPASLKYHMTDDESQTGPAHDKTANIDGIDLASRLDELPTTDGQSAPATLSPQIIPQESANRIGKIEGGPSKAGPSDLLAVVDSRLPLGST